MIIIVKTGPYRAAPTAVRLNGGFYERVGCHHPSASSSEGWVFQTGAHI